VNRLNLLEQLSKDKIIVIVRGITLEQADHLAEALLQGGIRFIEVTMNTEGALEIISRWKHRFGSELRIGAGTVLDQEMAKNALAAGAEYLISPIMDEEMIRLGIEQGAEVFPGTMTPTEMVKAVRAGAKLVKVFPTGVLGHSYIKELQGPLGHIPMMASGGVNLENIDKFIDAGCFALGMGSSLVQLDLIRAGKYSLITKNAKLLTEKIVKYS
jgi:2-dehydro-3-deoxyphosphogluconate aldolase/(4S)-4-hydroxy-2-oxoglutarate aldolase